MTRKQKLTLVVAALALLSATLGGIDYLAAGKAALGGFMLVGSGVGWIVLIVRLRHLRAGVPSQSDLPASR